MKRLFRLRRSRETVEADIDAELRFHFQRSVEQLVQQGMSRDAAEREAVRRFGDVSYHRRALEAIDKGAAARERRVEWLTVIRQNVGSGVRTMRRAPGLTAAIVFTLGLGIGANATVYGVVDRLLLRAPEHIVDAGQVQRIYIRGAFMGRAVTFPTMSYSDYCDFLGAEYLTGVGAYSTPSLTLGRGEGAVRVNAALATASFFPTLGVEPILGRPFTEEDDRIGVPGAALLGYEFWQRRFGGDPDVLGRTLTFAAASYTVVGVAPKGFTGVEHGRVDVWLPLQSGARELWGTGLGSSEWRENRNYHWIQVVGRFADNVPRETAVAELTALRRAGTNDAELPAPIPPTVLLRPLVATSAGETAAEARVAAWLAAVSIVVLLIACANVTNLLLSQAVRRRREIALRLTLGVSRARLFSQLFTESLLLSVLGGSAALLVAQWGGSFMRAALGPDVAWPTAPVNARVLAFTAATVVVTTIATGILPAVRSTRLDISAALKMSSLGSGARSRVQGALAVVQAALSVLLLVGAGLFVRSLHRIQHKDLGMDADRLVVASPEMDNTSLDTRQGLRRRTSALRRAADGLSSHPGVAAVGAANSLPFWSSGTRGVALPGRDSVPRLPSGGPYIQYVTGDYFRAVGLRVIRGRGLRPADDVIGAPRVAVVNETMARLLWPDDDPVGQCLLIGGRSAPCSEVVGVVRDPQRQSLEEQPSMQYFAPWGRTESATLNNLFVRTDTPSSGELQDAVRRELHALDPFIRFVDVRPLQDLIDPQMRSWRLGATMFSVFGALALLVAAIGLYSVLAFGVAQRTHELGVRAALGATSERLIALVFGEGIRLTAVGVGLGTIIALLAARAVAPLLYEVSPRDPVVYAAVIVTLGVAAVLAGSLPAWRATRADPNTALRSE